MNNYSGYSYHRSYNTQIPNANNLKYRGQSLPKLNKNDKSQTKLPVIRKNYNNNYRNSSLINNHKNYEQNLFGNMAININNSNTNIRKYINSFSEPRLPIGCNDLSYDTMKE